MSSGSQILDVPLLSQQNNVAEILRSLRTHPNNESGNTDSKQQMTIPSHISGSERTWLLEPHLHKQRVRGASPIQSPLLKHTTPSYVVDFLHSSHVQTQCLSNPLSDMTRESKKNCATIWDEIRFSHAMDWVSVPLITKSHAEILVPKGMASGC